MSLPLSTEHIAQLKAFIELVDKQPSVIHHPQLAFFKNFLVKLGAKITSETTDKPKSETFTKPAAEPEEEPEPVSEESDVELDMTGVIEPDNDDPQPMGDYDLQPTDEQIEESHSKRSEAVSAFVEKDYEKAIKLYTEAIQLNPQASLLYAKRGQAYILLNKPNACIRDCDRALELNPDSAAAHKFRGRANQLLGKWGEAASDLRLACKFDFDEQADAWLKEVTPNARKIEEHKRKKERKALEREEKARRERIRLMREAQAKASEEAKQRQQAAGADAQFEGMPGAAGQFGQFLNDPEIQKAFQDPEVAAAFKDISSNPSNLFKYQSNPKIMSLINKISSKFDMGGMGGMGGMPGMGGMGGMPGMGGMGGMPGMGGMGGMGGMPGFPGAGADAGPKAPPKSNNFEDFNLD